MRYAPLSSLTKSTTSQVSLPRVLPPMTLQELFNKFAPTTSPATLHSPSTASDPPSPPPSQSPAPLPSPQNTEPPAKTQEVSPAKTPVSTVDKQGRVVTKAGMRDVTDKPSALYQRWGPFGPRWPQRSCPLLSPLSLAKIGYSNAPTRAKPQRVTCVE